MRRRSSGLGVIELLFAMALILVTILTLISVFSKSSRQAVMSRNRTVAILLAHTLLDEIKAHPYGSPVPRRWTESRENPVTVYVEGRPQYLNFDKTLEYANGSFVGQGSGDTDEVTLTVRWEEGIGNDSGRKELQVRVPVWR